MCDVAVIGCGYWGPNLVRNLVALSGCRVKTICDNDSRRLAAITAQYPAIRGTRDYGEVLSDEDIEAVLIATPVRTHYALARRALESGKHVFVEKPLAASSDESQKLVDLAARQSLTLMVGHTFIYSTPVRKLKEMIDSGSLGRVMHLSARRLNLGLFQRDINVVWDLAPHDISIILYLLGVPPVSVNCHGNAHITPGVEDIATLSLSFPDGNLASIQVSWMDPRKVRELTVVGSRRMVVYDDLEPLEKLRVYDKSVEAPPRYDTFAEFQYSYHYGDVTAPYLKLVEPLRAECQHFLDCIRDGSSPQTSGTDGLRVTTILEAACRSLAQGGASVAIPAPQAADMEMRPA